jgi:hypothetical protein
MDKRFYKTVPSIPDQVYKTAPLKTHIMWVAFIGLGLILAHLIWGGGLALYLIALFVVTSPIYLYKIRKSVNNVYINETTVSAGFNNGFEIVNTPLGDYFLFVKKGAKSDATTKNYKYDVCLAHKGHLHGNENGEVLSRLSSSDKEKPILPLVQYIMCPKNLKEWIEGLQSQLKQPLKVAFETDDLRSDYETGTFMSQQQKCLLNFGNG